MLKLRLRMFGYETKEEPGEKFTWNKTGAHELMVGAILAQLIPFVSTIAENGVNNLVPFGFFAPLSVSASLHQFQRRQIKRLGKVGYAKAAVINSEYDQLHEGGKQIKEL